MRGTLEERFWIKVNKNGPIPDHCPERGCCWLWTAHCNNKGYGTIGLGTREQGIGLAHRVSYELATGTKLDHSVEILHYCDTPACVRPDHLTTGSHQDNMQDMRNKGRAKPGFTTGWEGLMGDNNPARRMPERLSRGEDRYNAKLTRVQVDEINELLVTKKYKQKEIAKLYGVSQSLISKISRGMTWSEGLNKRTDEVGVKLQKTSDRVSVVGEIMRLHNEGWSRSAIASHVGMSKVSVYRILTGKQWKTEVNYHTKTTFIKTPWKLNETIRRGKLTPDQVRDIRRRVALGEPQKSLSEEYRINTGTISEIVNHKVWANIPETEEEKTHRESTPTKEEIEQRILQLRSEGWGQTQIAQAIGCAQSQVSRVLSAVGKGDPVLDDNEGWE